MAAARAAGWRIWGETCTQYLFIEQKDLEEPDFQGAKYVFTPPPRPPHNHESLWRAITNGTLSAVSSDHCPFRIADQKTLGKDDFSKIPNGGPGIENRLHMLHHFGVREGRMSMNHLVDLCCTQPARLFGLFPRKGTIAVGSDADIVVWDSDKPLTLSAKTHHTQRRLQPVRGHRGDRRAGAGDAPRAGHRRGDELVASPGAGQFLRAPLRRVAGSPEREVAS